MEPKHMKFRCSICRCRTLIEEEYDPAHHLSRARCAECGSRMTLYYDEAETKVIMVIPDEETIPD